MKKIIITAGCVITILLTGSVNAAQKPNIIFILADDLGYGDVNCYGASTNVIQTPRIDQLAEEGIQFTDGHSPCSTCTPSRYSFLTGEYAWRTAGTGIASGVDPLLIDPDNVSLPSMLKGAGYNTAVVGKWHLGLGEGITDYNAPIIAPGPLEIGFDYYFGPPATGDRVPCVFMENHSIYNSDPADPLLVSYSGKVGNLPEATEHPELLVYYDGGIQHSRTIINGIGRIGWMDGATNAWWRDEDFADTFVDKASNFIEANTNTPFFLYFSAHDIHVPRAPHERFQGTSGHAWRGDAIHSLDWSVGALMDKVEELNLTTNTIFIFSSDNGRVMDDGYDDDYVDDVDDIKITDYGPHDAEAANGPFSGGKYGLWEGGTRVPFIVRWPGTVPSNTVSTALMTHTDLLASLAALTGQPLPTDAGPDSENMLPALLGQSGTGRTLFVGQNNNSNPRSLRQEQWKYWDNTGNLYDLTTDQAELLNLSTSNPGKAAEMAGIVADIAAIPMKSSLVAWWPLSDGTNVFDRSLNGYDGTLVSSPVSTTDGMLFDGIDDTVQVDGLPSIGGSMTLTCWARSAGATWNSDASLVARRPQFALTPVQGSKRLIAEFYSAAGAPQPLELDLADLPGFDLAVWHHYIADYNAVTGEARLFVDGELQTNTTFAAGALGASTGPLTLASDAGSFLAGDLADVRVYDQLLTGQRIVNTASARLLDADADTMLDEWECRFGLNPFNAADTLLDPDRDGITNIVEFAQNTDPQRSGTEQLVAYWPFDDGSGTTATDATGHTYDGSLVNSPAWTSDGGRDYLQFTSASMQYIEAPGLPSLGENMTVACWARSSTATWNIAGSLVSRRPQWVLHPWLNPPANKKYSVMVVDGGGTERHATINLSTLPSYALTDWHHYAGTYESSTGDVKVYIDGVLVHTMALTPGALQEATVPVWMGRDSTKERYFEGGLDEVRVYDYALDADEVLALTEGFDDDQDGMDDAVERQIIRDNIGDALVTLADVLPTDDYDGDGSNNGHEAEAGTDATSASDLFEIAGIDASGAETPFSIFVLGHVGRTYHLDRSTDLEDGPWTPIYQFGPLDIDRMVELYDAAPSPNAAYYKVRVTHTP